MFCFHDLVQLNLRDVFCSFVVLVFIIFFYIVLLYLCHLNNIANSLISFYHILGTVILLPQDIKIGLFVFLLFYFVFYVHVVMNLLIIIYISCVWKPHCYWRKLWNQWVFTLLYTIFNNNKTIAQYLMRWVDDDC